MVPTCSSNSTKRTSNSFTRALSAAILPLVSARDLRIERYTGLLVSPEYGTWAAFGIGVASLWEAFDANFDLAIWARYSSSLFASSTTFSSSSSSNMDSACLTSGWRLVYLTCSLLRLLRTLATCLSNSVSLITGLTRGAFAAFATFFGIIGGASGMKSGSYRGSSPSTCRSSSSSLFCSSLSIRRA